MMPVCVKNMVLAPDWNTVYILRPEILFRVCIMFPTARYLSRSKMGRVLTLLLIVI